MILKNLTVVDSQSSFDQKKVHLVLEKGHIKEILPASKKVSSAIDYNGSFVSPSWVDGFAHFKDPGEQMAEDIYSGSIAAFHGGFTDVFLNPNTNPPIEKTADILYVLSQNKHPCVKIHPIGSVQTKAQPNQMAELRSMHQHGVNVFSNVPLGIQDPSLLKKALQYTALFDGLIVQNPFDARLTDQLYYAESVETQKFGLKGIPEYAETSIVYRDLQILKHEGGRLHFSGLSCAQSIELIASYKKKGLDVSCSVSLPHLLFSDQTTGLFDANYKVFPPFRDQKNRKKLIALLNKGAIDMIYSGHWPVKVENKQKEYDAAEPGVSFLEYVYPAYQTYLANQVSISTFIERIAIQPRQIFGLSECSIENGSKASLTIFSSDEKSVIQGHSKSANNPLLDHDLQGNIKAVYTQNKLRER